MFTTDGDLGTSMTTADLVESPMQTETTMWHLRLYVAGQSPKSLRAFANLKKLCEEHLAGRYEIEIDRPGRAPRRWPAATTSSPFPTLVRRLPAPLRKIIGDLSDTERVLVGLRLGPE